MTLPNTEPADAVLSIRGVRKRYGELVALDGVSLHVAEGEFVALLGPNGAGKTTLFQVLTGLFAADDGDVHIAGHDVRVAPVAALAALGTVFQQPTLDLDLSVLANLRFHTRLHGVPAATARERIDAELARLDLAAQAGVACRTLSGGNRRKIELVRALLHEPRLLLMDEATVGLDPASRALLLEVVHDLRSERAMGVLWTTHLVDEAERADRVLILHRGKILREGTPASLVEETGEATLAEAFIALTRTAGKAQGAASTERAA